jgi:hypothetical protein
MGASIKVSISGFSEGIEKIQEARLRLPKVVGEQLQVFGNEGIIWLKKRVYANTLGLAPKRRDDGKPPLIDTGVYIESYEVIIESDFTMGIMASGMNTVMSNQALAELLEFGWGEVPARPHLRPLVAYMLSRTGVLGARIVRELFKE